MEPPRYRSGSVRLNRVGFQVGRMLYEAGCHSLRRRFWRRDLRHLQRQLDEDGLVVIPEFLPNGDFSRLRQAFEAWGRSSFVKTLPDHNGTGVTWVSGRLDTGVATTEPFQRLLLNTLGGDEVIRALVAFVMRRRVSIIPSLTYQALSVTDGHVDDKDVECLLHADRHFNTVKASLLMNANSERSGAFVFCKGSHRLSLARLRAEYDLSVRDALVRAGKSNDIDCALMRHGRNLIAPSDAASMNLQETAVVGEPNTLVLSNNRGFHRRGRLQPGERREQIRLVFHGLEVAWYGRLARHVLNARRRHRPSGPPAAFKVEPL